ncbi:MAG: c-type cytochrome, partial [Verrucomicrobiota bacterium]
DWGLPWYRPTRIIHAVTAGEYGWRSGSGKWPAYYADSLPAAVDIGLGSPTGVKFGTHSRFPEKYREALFAMDWAYGRIFAVHLKPSGATYQGSFENIVKGKPLNVTDLVFGKDGAMYFITGGRETQSGLYRVSYTGAKIKEKKTDMDEAAERDGKKARALRHQLEAFDGKVDSHAVDFAWPHLASDDRWIRYAARIALESQPVAEWKDRALHEMNANAGLTALLALARVGSKDVQNDLLVALKNLPVASLTEEQKLEKLRILELSFCRQGRPEPEVARIVTEKLNQYYPASTASLNHELCLLLVYLEAPGVATKTLALMDKAKTQEEQFFYIFALRNLKNGWTLDEHKHFFSWLKSAQMEGKTEPVAAGAAKTNDPKNEIQASREHPPQLLQWFAEAGREYADGASYPKYLVNLRKDAITNLSEVEKKELAGWIEEKTAPVVKAPVSERKFVKEWKITDLEPSLGKVASGRNFENGKVAFTEAQCVSCHRFGNEGGAVGPELTAASSKYSRHDILESILEPSKVLSEQFQNFIIVKKDGEDVTGRIVDENDDKVVVQPNPLAPDRVEVKKTDIAKRTPSKLSPMPEGLMNSFAEDDILDLLAYIESVGKKGAANFKK